MLCFADETGLNDYQHMCHRTLEKIIANTAVEEDAPEEQTFRGVRGKVR